MGAQYRSSWCVSPRTLSTVPFLAATVLQELTATLDVLSSSSLRHTDGLMAGWVWICPIRTKDATLLVSAFRKTPKVKAVKKQGGTVVLRSFLEQCYERRQVVSASFRFHIDDDVTVELLRGAEQRRGV